MKNIEVEFRFQVTDEEKARDFLGRLEFIKKSKQKDVYFDTESGDFYKRGIFIRTRDGRSLDFKFNLEDNAHEDCDEHSFSIPLTPKDKRRLNTVCKKLGLKMPKVIGFEDFRNINNLKEFVVIEKVREKFKDNEFTYVFDDVRGFGFFIEIESMAMAGSDLEILKKRMKEKVSILNPEFIPVGYIEFFVREMDFNLYKQGMYLFDEDR